jgi:hypothetical protein
MESLTRKSEVDTAGCGGAAWSCGGDRKLAQMLRGRWIETGRGSATPHAALWLLLLNAAELRVSVRPAALTVRAYSRSSC